MGMAMMSYAGTRDRDSLQILIHRTESDSLRVMLYNQMVRQMMAPIEDYQYVDDDMFAQAYLYADTGLNLARNNIYNEGEIEILRSVGILCYYSQRYEEAIGYFKQSYDLASQYGTDKQKTNAMYHIGEAYKRLEQYTQALECLNFASSIMQDIEDHDWTYDLNFALSELYLQLHDYNHSIASAKTAIELAKKQQDTIRLAQIYATMANAYMGRGDADSCDILYETAVKFLLHTKKFAVLAHLYGEYAAMTPPANVEKRLALLQKSRHIREFVDPNRIGLSKTCRAISDIYKETGQTDSSTFYQKKALRTILHTQSHADLVDMYMWLGNRAMNDGQLNEAERYFLDAQKYNRKGGSFSTRVHLLDQLSVVYGRKGDKRKMVQLFLAATELKDSLDDVDDQRRLNILQMHYEIREKREVMDLELRTQAEQQRQDISNSWKVIGISILVLILLAMLLVKLARNFITVLKTKKLLKESHEEMLLVQEQLSASNRDLNMYKNYLEDMVEKKASEQAQKDMQLYGLANNLSGSIIYRKIAKKGGRGELSYISSNISKLYGVSAETLIEHKSFKPLWGEEIVNHLEKREIAAAAQMEYFRYEFNITQKGKSIWLMVCAFPHQDNDTIIWDGFVINITPQKEKEQILELAKNKAEESDRLKSVFLSNMSHEIRTPMNAIMGFIGFVENEDLAPEKRHKYIETIRNSADQLMQLVESIIDISKIEIKQIKVSAAEFHLNELMHDLEDCFQQKTQGKLLFFELDDSRFMENDTLLNDRTHIRQVLYKLIDNAFKYTEKGYVRFGYREEKGTNHLLFFVEDTGIGITEDQQSVIFEHFRQSADTELKPKYGGTGLGLSISKGLVDAMNGRIWVESKLNEGSSFFFTIPKHLNVDES
jgi:PAS domain S-box-containing protein